MSEKKRFKSVGELTAEREDNLGNESSIAQLLFQSRTLNAWLLIVSSLGVAMLCGAVFSQGSTMVWQQIGGAGVYLGWFVLFYYVHEPHSPANSGVRHIVALLYSAAIGAQAVFGLLFQNMEAYEASLAILRTGLWFVGLVCPMLMILLSARLLVLMENDGKLRLDSMVGTYLAMFMLPIGIVLLQPRIRKLRSLE